jgi:Mycothiol maleylpyruvate isomerase N-terminal domain
MTLGWPKLATNVPLKGMTVTELRDPTAMANLGLAAQGRDAVLTAVLAAWDDFLEVASSVDLDRSTRVRGWRAHEVCVHLGVWSGYRAMDLLLASARDGGSVQVPDVDASNAKITAAHKDATRAQILKALKKHRDDVEHFAEQDPALDLAPTASLAGRLPLLTVIMGECYELAVHALDLASAGADQPPVRLLQAGISALTDVTGALAASARIDGRVTLRTPDGGWTVVATGEGWTTSPVAGSGSQARAKAGPMVSGTAATLLDASSGRANPVVQLAKRKLTVQDLPGLLRLAPLLSVAPNIPGGQMLALAAKTLSGATSLFGRRSR